MPRLAAVGRLYVLDREAVQRREVMRAQRYGAALWWQTATMTTTIRAIRDDEVNAFRIALMTVFGGDADDDPHGDDRFRHLVAREQAWAAFDGPHIVATAASYNMEIGIPGGTLPMAGLTNVTVRPTHRRRGLLRALIGHHLDDAKARGFAASGLWASEASIYRRFGYGMAASHDQVEISNAHSVNFIDGGTRDDVAWINEAQARAAMPAIYATATAGRPGAVRRTEVWWRERRFLEAPFVRAGASRRRHVLAMRADVPVGYVSYRQRGGFDTGQPSGKLEIIELIGIDAPAEATLWQFVMRVDLFPTVTWSNAPSDLVLPWLVDDWRRVQRTRGDNMWLRIDDVAAALARRRYQNDGTLCLNVDGVTWELTVRDGTGQCARATKAPDITLNQATLSSLYLGSVPAQHLAAAGWITGTAAAIASTDRLMAWPVAAWCAEIF